MSDAVTGPAISLVVYAQDISRLSLFYQRVLDLQVVESAPSHELLSGHSVEIVVHAIVGEFATEPAATPRYELRQQVAVKPVFHTAKVDLDSLRGVVEANGGYLAAAQTCWEWRGQRIIDGGDPEGNVVQFRLSL